MNKPIIVQYKVNAPIEKVWKALTNMAEMKSWYFDIPDFELEVGRQFVDELWGKSESQN